MIVPSKKVINSLAIEALANLLTIIKENPEMSEFQDALMNFEITHYAQIIEEKIRKE